MTKCQDSGAQILYPVRIDPVTCRDTAYCGCCGNTVEVTRRPGDTNEIPFYAIHSGA